MFIINIYTEIFYSKQIAESQTHIQKWSIIQESTQLDKESRELELQFRSSKSEVVSLSRDIPCTKKGHIKSKERDGMLFVPFLCRQEFSVGFFFVDVSWMPVFQAQWRLMSTQQQKSYPSVRFYRLSSKRARGKAS